MHHSFLPDPLRRSFPEDPLHHRPYSVDPLHQWDPLHHSFQLDPLHPVDPSRRSYQLARLRLSAPLADLSHHSSQLARLHHSSQLARLHLVDLVDHRLKKQSQGSNQSW